ncbi:MBL fold metallo-hydrolase [Mycolicibacterium sp. 120266]|uniref:MBL fold metallo-hydrolase n=1 Tax=Mycolicibacterium sp. 120266 TaxID=3090601 RepID=UPI00299CED1C|nr:MBL fold metallo-hydrolase [Mycolicibacterium sp. 120266]MDX1872082.1 MBL fold metallo-hydrolase [Mycolicibacterium sp. 120266]
MPVPLSVLYPDVSEDVWRSMSTDLSSDGRLNVPYGGFLAVDSSGSTVLIDTGGGPTPSPLPDGSLPHRSSELPGVLRALGVTPGQIDHVVLTHFHSDHIGWATVDGAPYFPNAVYHVHELEWASLNPEHEARHVLQPIVSHLAFWSGARAMPLPWLTLHHAPGHSPGNALVVVSDVNGQDALAFVGDLFHHPLGVANAEWRCGFDADAGAAARQRFEWAERLRAARMPIVSSHFPGMNPLIAY